MDINQIISNDRFVNAVKKYESDKLIKLNLCPQAGLNHRSEIN